jgi:transposase
VPLARKHWQADSTPCSSITPNTFCGRSNFRVGYAQTWQLAVQSDVPGALQMTATYLGIKLSRDPLFLTSCATLWACISIRRTVRWCCAWTRRVRSKLSIAPRRCCPCVPDRSSAAPKRHGTISLFAALDTRSSKIIGQTQQRHRSGEFRNFLDTIEKNVPEELDVHLILDNYGTHKTQTIRNWLAKRPRFHLHFTPTSASWLNLVERWFAALTEKQLRSGVHRSTKELEDATRSFIQHHNRDPKPFLWHKTADQILNSVARFCTRTLASRY